MKFATRHSLFAILFCILNSAFSILCVAQIKPSRSIFIEPLDAASASAPASAPAPAPAPAFMPSAFFAGSFQRGWGSYQDEQAWQLRLHGIVEMYRFGTDSNANVTTTFHFHHELTASSKNDLGFNPRTARWEEQLNVHVRASPLIMQFGFFHRCKHEIDNSEPPNDDTSIVYEPTRRVLIITGPSASVASPFFDTFIGNIRAMVGGEYYLVSEDYRTPSTFTTGSWNNLIGSIWLRGESTLKLSDGFRIFGSYYISFPFFTSRNGAEPDILVPHEARAEIAGVFVGTKGAIEVVFSADHTFDEVAFITPHPTTVLQCGIRLRQN